MRDRYYVRRGRVEKAIRNAGMVCYREWTASGRKQPYDSEYYRRWFIENHNIVLNTQANGVEKAGFASKGDMLMFLLRWS